MMDLTIGDDGAAFNVVVVVMALEGRINRLSQQQNKKKEDSQSLARMLTTLLVKCSCCKVSLLAA